MNKKCKQSYLSLLLNLGQLFSSLLFSDSNEISACQQQFLSLITFFIFSLYFFFFLHHFFLPENIVWRSRIYSLFDCGTAVHCGYHYYTTSFNTASTQLPSSFKSCSWRLRGLRQWETLTLIPAGNKV